MKHCIKSSNAFLAQSVEHAAVNRSVVGSSPTGGAKNPCSEEQGFFMSNS